jgi:RNA polymerase sigma factor (sigma-70 family)
MRERDWLEERFDAHRAHLRAVAYRMLGSIGDADAAIHEARLLVGRADSGEVEDVRAWLTSVVYGVSLDMLSARPRLPESSPDVTAREAVLVTTSAVATEEEVRLGEAIGLALLVALESLSPAERLAFVMSEIFAVPLHQIAAIVNSTPAEASELARRARRRVRGQSLGGHTSASGRVSPA